jgi:phospho-N-acetylmuramoyl-pentapeptide-transferase
MSISAPDVIKVLSLGFISVIVTFLFTPALTSFLYNNKLWKKKVRDKSIDGKDLPIFQKFHSNKEIGIPRMGGVLFWITALFLSLFFYIISFVVDVWWIQKLNFLSREQTWLPLFALIAASLIGLIDDLLQVVSEPSNIFLKKIFTKINKYIGGGLSLKYRLFLVGLIGLIGGFWFHFKLNGNMIDIPLMGEFFIGIWYIPLFILVMVATYSGGVVDGLDGLSGGTFASIFGAYTVIALSQQQFDLAAFCAVLMGSILTFLWFNIPPARFYMGESGIIGLCVTLTIVAFLTNSVLVLPIIAFILVIESLSVIIQLLSKKFLKKKIFLASPIHHHFEAKNWPHYKITMRFWIIGIVMAILGVTIKLFG